MTEAPLDKPLSLNEEKAVRGYFLLQNLHLRERSLWRKTPTEIESSMGLNAQEVARAAGRSLAG